MAEEYPFEEEKCEAIILTIGEQKLSPKSFGFEVKIFFFHWKYWAAKG